MGAGKPSLALRALGFTLVILVLSGLCAGVSYSLAGRRGLEAALWATALCLPPGWLVFLFEPLYRLPRQAIYGSLLGSMIRLGFVFGGVLLVLKFQPQVPRGAFVGSLAVQYLGGLALETLLLMRGLGLRPPRSAMISSQAAEPAAE